MDPSQIDKALDMRLVLSLEGSLPIAEFSRNRSMHFQAGLMLGEKTVDVSCFIPDDLEQNREVSIFLAQNKVRRMNRNFILNFSFEDPAVHNALTDIVTTMNSVIIDNLTLKNGVYYISFRFHSSEMTKISNEILKHSSESNKIGINYLGKNPGINFIASEARSYTPLVGVSFETSPPKDFLNGKLMKALGDTWVSEARYMSNTEMSSYVVRTQEQISEPEKYGISVIDQESNLYGCEIFVPMLSNYLKKSYESRIIRMRRTLALEDGILKAGIIVPEITSSEILNVLSDTGREMPDWKLTLSEYRSLNM